MYFVVNIYSPIRPDVLDPCSHSLQATNLGLEAWEQRSGTVVNRIESYSHVLYYFSIPEFIHAIPMQVLTLCSNYAHFIIEKTPQNHYIHCHVHTSCDTGIQLFILAAVTDGQIVTVPILVAFLRASPG